MFCLLRTNFMGASYCISIRGSIYMGVDLFRRK